MPRRQKLPTVAPLVQAAAVPQPPPLIPSGIPALDRALRGGIPLNRITEISSVAAHGRHLLAARFVTQRLAAEVAGQAAWLDLGLCLAPELLSAAGVPADRVTLLTPRDGAETLHRSFTFLAMQQYQAIVIAGLPRATRGDLLFISLLERIALLVPQTRSILLYLTDPTTTSPALARLAAVRLGLAGEDITHRPDATIYTATATVLKHRYARPGVRVALRLVTPRGPHINL
jgi:hypothetical protein